ncbi:MAG: hypothetical protein K1X83_14590, partial [Oligoflexia bacterium]|nr:hypothetical protein [Oligoflexia bacterium]
DAWSLSMAGSADVVCRSASCIYLNPAGLASLRHTTLVLSADATERNGNEFIENKSITELSNSGYAVLAVPLGRTQAPVTKLGTFALAYARYKGEVNDRIRSAPDGHLRSFGYGYGSEEAAIGYSFTFYDDQLHSKLADLHSHSRFLHVFGVQSRLSGGLEAGATFKLGIGQSDTEEIKTQQNGLSHLREYAGDLGLTYRWSNASLSAAMDYFHVQSRGNLGNTHPAVVIGSDEGGNGYGIHLGGEWQILDVLPLRAGVRWYEVADYEFDNPNLLDLSGGVDGFGYATGIGYILKVDSVERARLDYAMEYFTPGRGAWQHLVTLTIPFGA